MRRDWIFAAALAAASVCATAQAGVLVPIPPVPEGSATYITAINNKNIIAGFYTSTTDRRDHGFVGGLDGNYTTFVDVYGGAVVEGLNDDGYIVGHTDGSTADCYLSGYGCQFLRKPDGTIQEITKDRAPLDGMPGQINNRREFVGKYAYSDDGITREPNFWRCYTSRSQPLRVGFGRVIIRRLRFR
jgi:hypothetical protein